MIEGLDDAEHGRLHGLLARALPAQGGEAAEIARHLVGAGDPEAAALAFAQAAQESLDSFANGEVEELSNAGPDLAPGSRAQCRLLEARAEARGRRGDFAGARDDLRAALTTGSGSRPRILIALAKLTSGFEDYRERSS